MTQKRVVELEKEVEKWKMVFNSFYGGILVTDANGVAIEINEPYCEFLGVDKKEIIGTHCTDVIEGSRMHIVAKTGKPEINHIQEIDGQNILVRRIPIKRDGDVVAVVGYVMFKDIQQLSCLAKKISLLQTKVKLYEQELRNIRSTRYTFESIIGSNKTIERLKKEALIATSNNFPVLITGESGTGKELFAQAIHHGSARNIHPFIRINCSAIPGELLESELFGYEKGAFTGAKSGGKPGKFELAHKGTIFLDEIGELPMSMQPKFLRVLEEKEFERVGGTKVLRSDFRLIAATNRNLEEMIKDNTFRKDLYYRMNVINLHIPPLRERREDISILSRSLLSRIADKEILGDVDLSSAAEKVLASYSWPGNVRELSNVLERTVASLENSTITPADLPYFIQQSKTDTSFTHTSSLKAALADAEKDIIINTLKLTENNKTHASQILGIHRTLLYKKMVKHSIEYPGI